VVYEVYVLIIFQDYGVDDFYDPNDNDDLNFSFEQLTVFINNIIKENLMSGQQNFKLQDDYQKEQKTCLGLHLIPIKFFTIIQNYFNYFESHRFFYLFLRLNYSSCFIVNKSYLKL
jgi:hypothetical protein